MVSYPPAGTRFGRCYTPCLSRQPVTPCKSGVRWQPGQELPPLVLYLPVTLSGALFYASCVLLSRFASGPFTTLLLARPGYQPVWGLHTPYLCSGYRILTDATVGSFWIGVSLCAVYLRLQAHVKGAVFTANRQLFFKGWPPCSECPGSSWLPSRPKGASVCFLHRNRTGSGRPSTALPDQPSVSLPRRHSERRPKSALRMGLTGSPTGTFFYQPAAPSVIKTGCLG